jgi:hypothetical protein
MIERINMEFELKNYEIKGVLGEWGMAVVYLAEPDDFTSGSSYKGAASGIDV